MKAIRGCCDYGGGDFGELVMEVLTMVIVV